MKSTKKTIAIVLFVLQGVALIGAATSGSMIGASIVSWVGFCLFGIIGGVLMYQHCKANTTNENEDIKSSKTSSIDSQSKEDNNLIERCLRENLVFYYNDTDVENLKQSSMLNGIIDEALLLIEIAKLKSLVSKEQNIIDEIFNYFYDKRPRFCNATKKTIHKIKRNCGLFYMEKNPSEDELKLYVETQIRIILIE